MQKRGQFYLISAIILAAIVISLVTISNYSKKDESSDLQNLKDEIQIEGARVLDYGIYNGLSQVATNQLVQNFIQEYINFQSRDKNLYFIFGKDNNITLKGYQNEPHTITLDSVTITNNSGAFLKTIDPATNNVNLIIDENPYSFTLKSGENFYFLISKKTRGGDYVITG
jgi:hypothetical protein